MIPQNSKVTLSNTLFETFCDKGIFISLCLLILVLPASIAYLDSFAALTIFFYLLKKIGRIISDWPKAAHLDLLGKFIFIWNGFSPPENFLNRPLWFLVLAILISVVFSQYPLLSLLAFLGKFLKCVFLYFSFIEVVRGEKRIRIFLGFFAASAFITALNGGIQHYIGRDLLKGHLISGDRVNSFFTTANGLGAYLLPMIGIVIYFIYAAFVKSKSWVWGILGSILLATLLVALCWSYSRSSWVGFLSILVLMTLLDWRKIFFAGALFLIFIFMFLPSLNQVRHLYLINDNVNPSAEHQETSVPDIKAVLNQGGSGRIKFWRKAVSIIQMSPICGTGLNTYARILQRDPSPTARWYAHNCYLQMAAEIGLVGLSSFLWLLFVLFKNSFSGLSQIKEIWPHTFLYGSIVGLFGFLFQSFFDNTFYTVQLGVLMWLIFGLLVALTRLKSR